MKCDFWFTVLVNYREKYGSDPTPDTENKLLEEAEVVFQKYEGIKDKLEALLKWVYNTFWSVLFIYLFRNVYYLILNNHL